ncbi:Lambda phage tail tape-measure protein (Tape_meas_lam_C) [Pseudosulfitobacter pseudonitzschiae]|uniref:Bacteriophage tail tape measure C-terminal domain-containing protein n=1 Tax=Pseudosulfitobacter pseudonitzschiae TaxID=1402135 RepID=A0A073J665_9RHOB|nr:phage tail tape measure C-terminal domain-containing protein [Pseudosulfitobacter pseudonitzschiae]KEJ97434.1 hypothetical protein SUH3_00175 [Pseudosulfitobacter pseudonitzschiae]QKS08725.1 hypothetical protein HT745_09665 [Pseudosulfitobacter pseudonitzschiae]SHE71014.1 Lambda phage tail tape-measure protein (Tape_meas_lam_C) [Pseudosulfitobacter pseudonitzschiae]
MGQSVIGALRVNLGLDSAKFEKGAGAADRSLQKMKLQFAAVAGAAAAFGAALSTAALAGAKQIDEAAKAARRLDSSIGGFRALELSAGEAGVSLSGLTNDIQTMNRELASVGVSGNGKRALEALGLELSDLQGIDADEKLAVIADRVKALGLSSGKTTAILRDLGVRNREMALLVLQGGDAIRNARADIKAYGLEVSKFDASAIETANDQIGRLGLIGQYAGQQLAIALVPTLGALAQTMTDSLKEGGLLRAMIDGFTQNLSAFAGVAAVASTAFGVRYVGALVLAKVATFSLSGAVIALRGALVSTGIGAVVVAAGVLVGKFADLVASTGGFGNALTLLGEVAAGVWDGITISAGAIPPALNSVWKLVQSGFFEMMSHIQENWSRFLGNLGQDLAEVPGLGKAADAVLQASGASSAAMSEFNAMAQSAANSAAALKAEAGALATEGFDRAREAAAKLSTVVEETGETTDSLNEVLDETGAAGGKAAKGAKKASKALSEAEKEAKRLREEMQRPLVNAIGGVADAFGDFVSRGFKDFKGFAKSIVGGFQQMISQMIGLAARNRIMLSMGLTGGGAGAAVAGVPGLGQVGGIFGGAGGGGGLLGGLGGIGSALTGGFMNSIGSLFSGGIGGMFGSIGAQLGTAFATGTGTAIAGAIGAIAAPLLAVAAVFSFFKKKVTELDAGLRITVDGMDALVETFRTIETKRFWGLSKKVGTSYSEAADDVAAPLQKAIGDIGKSIMEMGTYLGFDAENIDLASFQFKISTKGKTEEEIQKAIADEMERLSDVFADAMVGSFDEIITTTTNILGGDGLSGLFGKFLNRETTETISHVNEEFEALKRVGEGSFDTLQRIVTSLQAVNPMMDALGLQLYDLSLVGGDAASSFVDLFGSLQDFGTITGAYYQEFYTAQERTAKATQRLTKELSDLGINTLPGSRAAFRALVDEADSLGDTELVAALIKLSPAFAEITAVSDALSESLANNALFKTKADEIYARTAGGYLASIEDIQTAAGSEMTDLLREVVRAIREGDVNSARLTNQLFNLQRRATLEPDA